MSLASYALTTVARFKTYADISTASDDTLLEDLVNAVSDWVENYCGRRFKQTAHSQKEIDSDGSKYLFCPEYPVSSTASFTLEIRTSAENEDEWESIDSEDYFVDYDNGIITIAAGNWLKGKKKYRVTYTAGYNFDSSKETDNLTDVGAGDLEVAVWKLLKSIYDERREDARVTRERLGDYDVTFARIAFEDDPTIGSVLNRYRKIEGMLSPGLGPDLY